MPISKLTRVRVLVFMKIIATARPASTDAARDASARLQLAGQTQQGQHFGGREVVDREEAAPGEVELRDVGF